MRTSESRPAWIRQIWAMVLISPTMFGIHPFSQAAMVTDNAVLGQWWTPGFSSRVVITRCADGLCGHIAWAWNPQRVPVGTQVLSGFNAVENKRWSNGTAFNPADGNTYRAVLSMVDDARLVVTGCLLVFCREQVWLRVGTVDKLPIAVDHANNGTQ